MEGMDDSASLKDATEVDDVEDKNNDAENPVATPADPDPVKIEDFDPKTDQLVEPAKFAPKDLLALLRNIIN